MTENGQTNMNNILGRVLEAAEGFIREMGNRR
jgi:hypothetical protein